MNGAEPARPRHDLASWLIRQGARHDHIGDLLGGLCDRLVAAGVPLSRATTHIQTLHPQYRSVMRVWRRGQPVQEIRPVHAAGQTTAFLGSPVRTVWETGEWVERHLDQPLPEGQIDYPIYTELRDQGVTHYVMTPVAFSDGTIHAVSWATEMPGGFSDEHRSTINGLLEPLALVLEILARKRVSTEVLQAYVGFEPGERILSGAIRRGETRTLRAAILMADLRGFTTLSETLTPDQLVEVLNTYLDCVVPPVEACGGEIMKFIGDGVLAIFRESGDVPSARACALAIEAADDALAALARLRGESGQPALRAGIALHYGDVAYGNIGSGNRLDFTVIGRDVNLASRIEQLCGELDRPLLLSEAFARQLEPPPGLLGAFTLKGIPEPQRVFERSLRT